MISRKSAGYAVNDRTVGNIGTFKPTGRDNFGAVRPVSQRTIDSSEILGPGVSNFKTVDVGASYPASKQMTDFSFGMQEGPTRAGSSKRPHIDRLRINDFEASYPASKQMTDFSFGMQEGPTGAGSGKRPNVDRLRINDFEASYPASRRATDFSFGIQGPTGAVSSKRPNVDRLSINGFGASYPASSWATDFSFGTQDGLTAGVGSFNAAVNGNAVGFERFEVQEGSSGKESSSSLAICGERVCFRFGRREVLKSTNIAVERGIIYALLGPSGCGKTTLLRCIVGRHRPSGGTIRIYGKLPGQRGFCVPGPGVGFMPQELALYPEITTEETLTYFGRLYQMSDCDIKERVAFLADFLDIPDKRKQIKTLSGGQQRRVSFAVALIHKPPLVILDEPTVGVDPLLRKSIWNYLQKLASVDFLTIMITTHYVEEARQAHMVGLMRDGRLLAEADPEYLINLHQVATLEEVFLKLCLKDIQACEALEGGSSSQELQKVVEESPNDVWVLRKRQRNQGYLPSMNGNGSDHKASLLADTESVLSPDQSCGHAIRTSASRMGALINKNFVRLKRNVPLVFFQVFVPTFQVIVFCLCVGGEPYGLPLAVVNCETDPSGKSSFFLEHIDSHIIAQVPFANLSEATDSVKRGDSWGVLYIPPTFTDSLINRYMEGINADNETIEEATVKLFLDMSNQQIASTVYSKVMNGFQQFSTRILQQFYMNPMLARPPLILGEPIYGSETTDFTQFMAPGMIMGITYIMAVGLSSMSIIIEKKEGLLDRSWIAGVRSWEVVFSILFVLFVVMLFQVALVLLLTFSVFKIDCLGPLTWVVVAVLLVGLEGMCYGLFISSIVNDENIAVMIAMGSFYPNLLLSGIIWPLEAMPSYLRHLSYGLPLTLIADSMRSILSKGWDITDNGIWLGYLVALAWIVPVILVSSLFFRYKK